MKWTWIAMLLAALIMAGCGMKKEAKEARLDLTSEEVSSKEITENAVDFLLSMSESIETLREAFDEITSPGGKFHEKNHYVYVYDFDGVCVAHGGDANLKGKNLLKNVDADGNPVVEQMIRGAQEKGEGWIDVAIAKPDSEEIERSKAYYKRVGDIDYVVGSGYFRK